MKESKNDVTVSPLTGGRGGLLLELSRKKISRMTCDGILLMDGKKICDTAENAQCRIPEGLYELKLPNDIYFDVGNGVYTLADSEILVGERLVPGVVIHSHVTFKRLYNRLLRAAQRGRPLLLLVRE